MARPKAEQPPVDREVKEVDIPCLGKVGTRVELMAIPPS